MLFFLLCFYSLIDTPTPHILKVGSYDVEFRFGDGSLIGRVGVSILKNFSFGISYGGENIIGKGDIKLHGSPGVQVKYGGIYKNIIFALGYDCEKYLYDTLGLYGVFGADFKKVIPFAGLYYNTAIKLFFSSEFGLLDNLHLLYEMIITKNIISNIGIRWLFGEGLSMEFNVRDITDEKIRSIKFTYITFI